MPFRSSLARSAGKLLGVFKEADLSLRGATQSSREIIVKIAATGGSTSTVGDKKVHKFIADGNFTITAGSSIACEVFVVGGGGAGGGDSGGGGGAGAVVYGTSIPYGPGTYAVVVGDGGSGQPTYYTDPEANFRASAGGENSTISHPSGTITGGGGNAGGMTYPSAPPAYAQSPASDGNTGSLGSNGGSHVGSPGSPLAVSNAALTTPYPTPGTGTYNVYRNQGGSQNCTSQPNLWAGGGGGGAGGAGSPSSPTGVAGDGGDGYNASGNIPWIPASEGVSGYFAGGGGSGAPDNGSGGGGTGGSGGGGDGSDSPSDPGSGGTANSGGGGGGHDAFSSPGGGSGIVYVAYPV